MSSPPAGLTYGAHGIWSWETTPKVPLNHERTGVARPWREAMALAGSTHMKRLADFFAPLRWWDLRPDDNLLAEQPGRKNPERYASAARYEDGKLAVAKANRPTSVPPGTSDAVLRRKRMSRIRLAASSATVVRSTSAARPSWQVTTWFPF